MPLPIKSVGEKPLNLVEIASLKICTECFSDHAVITVQVKMSSSSVSLHITYSKISLSRLMMFLTCKLICSCRIINISGLQIRIIFLISQSNILLYVVLKRTASMRGFFPVPKTHV